MKRFVVKADAPAVTHRKKKRTKLLVIRVINKKAIRLAPTATLMNSTVTDCERPPSRWTHHPHTRLRLHRNAKQGCFFFFFFQNNDNIEEQRHRRTTLPLPVPAAY